MERQNTEERVTMIGDYLDSTAIARYYEGIFWMAYIVFIIINTIVVFRWQARKEKQLADKHNEMFYGRSK